MDNCRFSVIKKLHKILDSQDYKSSVQWCRDGTAFCLFSPESFHASDLCKELGVSSLRELKKTFKSFKFSHNTIETESSGKLQVFKNKYFRQGKDHLLKFLNITPASNTMQELRSEMFSPSLFNIKVIEALKKLSEYFRLIVADLQQGPILNKKMDRGIIKEKKIIIYEKHDASEYVSEIAKDLRVRGFLVDLTFLYNEFDKFLTLLVYDFVIIDYDLYDIYQTLSSSLRLRKSHVILTINSHNNKKTKDKSIFILKPYDLECIVNTVYYMLENK